MMLGSNYSSFFIFIVLCKLKYWNEELAAKATQIVSSCPKTTPSFIAQETTLEVDENGIERIKIIDSVDPATYSKSGNF